MLIIYTIIPQQILRRNSFVLILSIFSYFLLVINMRKKMVFNIGMLTISKLDLASESLIQNGISEYPNTAYNCRFAAHGNTVYYASGTVIYRANFNPEAGGKDVVDEFLVDLAELDTEAGLLYNGLGVNPITGNVFINTLKGFGNNYTTNSIWEFDFDTSSDTPLNKYDNYTRFPAGMYFNK